MVLIINNFFNIVNNVNNAPTKQKKVIKLQTQYVLVFSYLMILYIISLQYIM